MPKTKQQVIDITLTEAQVARLSADLDSLQKAADAVWYAVTDVATEQYSLIRDIDKPRSIKAAELIQAMLEPAYEFKGDVTFLTFKIYVTRACRILAAGGTVKGKAYQDLDELSKAANKACGVSRAKGGGRKAKATAGDAAKVEAKAAPDFWAIFDRNIKNQAFKAKLQQHLRKAGLMVTGIPMKEEAATPIRKAA